MYRDEDFALALQLQAKYDEEAAQQLNYQYNEKTTKDFASKKKKHSKESMSIVDEFWEVNDPNPDIHGLFLEFNDTYFWGRLQGVEVRWSPRMTLCAGLCSYEGRGGLCSIRLSTPLLKLRPRKDLVQTLLHEMIHAYLFVTQNNKDHDSHGPEFHKHMTRINLLTGAKITVYHNFHDEVNEYRQHWWRCTGPCQKRPPYYGIVRRAMNRPPAPRDFWWEEHQKSCGGVYVKIKEPEEKSNKRKPSDKQEGPEKKLKSDGMDIRSCFGAKIFTVNSNFSNDKDSAKSTVPSPGLKTPTLHTSIPHVNQERHSEGILEQDVSLKKSSTEFDFVPFTGHGHRLGGRNSMCDNTSTTNRTLSSQSEFAAIRNTFCNDNFLSSKQANTNILGNQIIGSQHSSKLIDKQERNVLKEKNSLPFKQSSHVKDESVKQLPTVTSRVGNNKRNALKNIINRNSSNKNTTNQPHQKEVTVKIHSVSSPIHHILNSFSSDDEEEYPLNKSSSKFIQTKLMFPKYESKTGGNLKRIQSQKFDISNKVQSYSIPFSLDRAESSSGHNTSLLPEPEFSPSLGTSTPSKPGSSTNPGTTSSTKPELVSDSRKLCGEQQMCERVTCPICGFECLVTVINQHLDSCLKTSS
ncbi:sprT-like domain-containing protein Spartan [Limulus polyphemus]|uniref:Protein with SprT-like domain at the N terminus n=1 Tax=Limulus polyphemus TaxID=6850 RepID=A0ABM1TFL2_LIMPO|nr:sprT-like domain-containing protein Spartan [Limulus polyphemus]XP_022254668.1 sprT-like domain-containing protein Spartan [Limulus polyphemus]